MQKQHLDKDFPPLLKRNGELYYPDCMDFYEAEFGEGRQILVFDQNDEFGRYTEVAYETFGGTTGGNSEGHYLSIDSSQHECTGNASGNFWQSNGFCGFDH